MLSRHIIVDAKSGETVVEEIEIDKEEIFKPISVLVDRVTELEKRIALLETKT